MSCIKPTVRSQSEVIQGIQSYIRPTVRRPVKVIQDILPLLKTYFCLPYFSWHLRIPRSTEWGRTQSPLTVKVVKICLTIIKENALHLYCKSLNY